MTVEAKLPEVYQLPNINQRPAMVAESFDSTFNLPQFQEDVENEPALPDWRKPVAAACLIVGSIGVPVAVVALKKRRYDLSNQIVEKKFKKSRDHRAYLAEVAAEDALIKQKATKRRAQRNRELPYETDPERREYCYKTTFSDGRVLYISTGQDNIKPAQKAYHKATVRSEGVSTQEFLRNPITHAELDELNQSIEYPTVTYHASPRVPKRK